MLNVKSSDLLDHPSATMRLSGKTGHEYPLQKYDRLKKEQNKVLHQQSAKELTWR